MKKITERSKHGYSTISTTLSWEAEKYAEAQCREYIKRIANSIEAELLPQELRGKIWRANLYAMFGLPRINTAKEEKLLGVLES